MRWFQKVHAARGVSCQLALERYFRTPTGKLAARPTVLKPPHSLGCTPNREIAAFNFDV